MTGEMPTKEALQIARHSTDTAELAKLVRHSNNKVRKTLTDNLSLSKDDLLTLAKDRNQEVKCRVLENTASEEILNILAADKSTWVLHNLVEKENLSLTTYAILVANEAVLEDYSILKKLINREDFPFTLLKEIPIDYIEDSSLILLMVMIDLYGVEAAQVAKGLLEGFRGSLSDLAALVKSVTLSNK